MVWVGGGAEAWCSAARSGLRIGLPCARPHCAAHPTLHPTTPPTLISLRNRELSSVELRSLDFEYAPGSASRTDPALERTIEALYVEAEESRLAAAGRGGSVLEELLDISPLLHDAGAAIVDDSFLR